MRTVASLTDLSQSVLTFDPSLQFSVSHLSISVCTQFHLVLDERILGIKFSFNATLLFIDKHRVQKV